ncbi:hypothetical protein HII36_29875 [Nonomuraea sp. NN258]|uniref:hypothetical protein n=1 Tax=Nonomuraea antri TaxID=2730852 RepID=UPI001569F5A4|nr:hypothetical protein [Nonomuraea antri]NRQ36010.1 hypothetical protein [Nonomuraea antri]
MADEMHPCARGTRCAARTKDGPALSYRPFCDTDRSLIAQAIQGMPLLYAAMADLLVADRSGGFAYDAVRVTTSQGRPVPINLDADASQREMAEILVSWEERVRDVARMPALDTAASRGQRLGVLIAQAVTVLAPRLDALLALQAAPMVRGGELVDLDGAGAGLEILDVRRRAVARLPESGGDDRPLSVPCGGCGWRGLIEVLDFLGHLAGARCRQCGHRYDVEGLAELRAATLRRAARRAAANMKGDR